MLTVSDAPLTTPVVNTPVLFTEELTVVLPIVNITVVNLTLAPTLAAKPKLPVPTVIADDVTSALTVVLPTNIAVVLMLMLAPTLAPVLKLPVPIVRTVLLTTAEPIAKLAGVKFAIDELLAILSRIEFANIFEVLFPICKSVVDKFTFEPTFAPITKLPTLTVTVEVLALNEPIANPVGDTFDVDVALAIEIKTELVIRLAVVFPI